MADKTTVVLGRTGIETSKNGFGALPIQRVSRDEAAALLCRAFDGGMTYFDTAYSYTDSEEKIGYALHDVRSKLFIATKTPSVTTEGFWSDLETSLTRMRTDYIDVYQFHNPDFCPLPGDGTGLYEAMLEAKKQGKIRHIGLTNHRLPVARAAIDSGIYDLLQFPFSYLSGKKDIELVRLCKERQIGFVAMKGLSGGMISNAAAAYVFMLQHDNVLPIWGVQRMHELEEFLAFEQTPPAMTEELAGVIAADRKELALEFCRSCGYCMPCPQGIEIPNCTRISMLLRRSPAAQWLTAEWQEKMHQTKQCVRCGQCTSRCPYNLDIPAMLERNYSDYLTFL